jgi:hypothetical protein
VLSSSRKMKRVDPHNLKRIVLVEWIDSYCVQGWHSPEELPDRPVSCVSVGYIYQDNDVGIGLVASVAPEEVADPLFIPRFAVLKVEALSVNSRQASPAKPAKQAKRKR